jgi:hypothetical protein
MQIVLALQVNNLREHLPWVNVIQGGKERDDIRS